jgi:ABC-type uncharacterized transport system permease subunit
MKTCPPTITLLSFLFVAIGVISTAVHVWQFKIVRPTFLEEVGVYAIGALAVVAGIYMLRGRNWARWLALGWICLHVIVAAFNQPIGLVIHVVFVALLAWLLFRRESQQWFSPRPVAATPTIPLPPDPPPPVD